MKEEDCLEMNMLQSAFPLQFSSSFYQISAIDDHGIQVNGIRPNCPILVDSQSLWVSREAA
jgi:hypothetical protein